MSDVNNDIIRSLLDELITRVNETKGDKNIQKQNDKIIGVLNDVKNSINNAKIDTEKLVNELSDQISSKINKVIEETSKEEIANLKEIDKNTQHQDRLKEERNNTEQRNLNPNATEDEAKKVTGNGGSGNGGNNNKNNNPNSPMGPNGQSKWAVAAEALLATLGMATEEVHKGLDSTFKAFNTLSEAGNNFNGSAMDMRKSAYDSGMTLEQFTKTVSTSNASFKILNSDSIVRFNKAVSDAANSNLGLSLTTDQRNSYEQDYINILAAQGKTARQSTKDTSEGFIDLIKQSRQLSSVFGESAESISKKATEFLSSREGYLNITSQIRNSENAQEFTSVGQAMGRQLQLPENIQTAIMNFAASGGTYASQDLRRFMGQGGAELVRQMTSVLEPIANSVGKFNSNDLGKNIAQAYRNIGGEQSGFDRVNSATRAQMLDNRNSYYETAFTVSNAARNARTLNPEDIINSFGRTNQNADITATNSQAAYNNKNINLGRAEDTIETTALASFRETIASFEDVYKKTLDTMGQNNNAMTDAILGNRGIGRIVNATDKGASGIIAAIGNNKHFQDAAGIGITGGHIIADAMEGLGIGSSGLLGYIGLSSLRNMSRKGGGQRGLTRDLTRGIPRIFNRRNTSSVSSRAANIAEEAENLGGSNVGRIGSKVLPALKGATKLAGDLAMPLGFALQGFDMIKDYTAGDKENLKKDTAGMGNLAAATATGALIGSVVPVAGTAVGAGIGFTVGELANMFGADKWLSDNIQNMMHPGSITKNKSNIDNIKDTNQLKPHKLDNIEKSDTKQKTDNSDSINNSDEQNIDTKQNDLDSIMINVQEIVNLLQSLLQSSGNIHQETTTQNNLLYDQFSKLNSKPPSVVRMNKIQ